MKFEKREKGITEYQETHYEVLHKPAKRTSIAKEIRLF